VTTIGYCSSVNLKLAIAVFRTGSEVRVLALRRENVRPYDGVVQQALNLCNPGLTIAG
jgi:hypothetical protein